MTSNLTACANARLSTPIWPRARHLIIGSLLAGFSTVGFAQSAAVVNGEEIPAARVEAFVSAMVAQGRPDNEQLRQAVREELIARALFVQEAKKRALDKLPEVDNQLVRSNQDILIGALIRDTLANSPVTDEQIAAEYATVSAAQPTAKEFKARHILVEEEAVAVKIIADLDQGADFAELAKVSKDPGSAARGGDLDWNTPTTFVPAFAAAMTALEKGKYTTTPVKTEYGYHVILLDDSRSAEAPSLESVKPQLKQQLERKIVVDLQNSLREAAKIE